MSWMRGRDGGVGAATTAVAAAEPAAGKRTLTEQLPAVQRRAEAGADGGAADDVHAAAAHGTRGPAGPLPFRDQIQRAFGRHDVSGVQAHVGGAAAEGAGAMGAQAFAVGDRVAFASAPDLHLAAHEAAHVVQQRGGVQLKGGVGEAGDAYEQHADAVADLVVRGESAEGLLDAHAAPGAAGAGPGAVQRYAFVGGTQIKKSDPIATGAAAAFVTDATVRDYTSKAELTRHAAGQTDYLGNLRDGTWVRFHPTGMNVLGEMHTLVPFREVLAAIGGTASFIDERVATDDMAKSPNMGAAYETEGADAFQELGIAGKADKRPFGAESLVPKVGFALSLALPTLESGELSKLTTEEGYTGKVVQRYLKIGWGLGKDMRAEVLAQQKAKQAPPAQAAALAKIVTDVEAELDPFLASLPVDAFFGDAFVDNDNAKHLPAILKFVRAAIDALVERGLGDASNRMTAADKAHLAAGGTNDEKFKMFGDWRNFQFEDSVAAAAQRGVRYAGMGAGHLYHLQDKGLPKGSHPFDMSGPDLDKFQHHTHALKRRARTP